MQASEVVEDNCECSAIVGVDDDHPRATPISMEKHKAIPNTPSSNCNDSPVRISKFRRRTLKALSCQLTSLHRHLQLKDWMKDECLIRLLWPKLRLWCIQLLKFLNVRASLILLAL